MPRTASSKRVPASRSIPLLIALLIIGLVFGLLANWGRQMMAGSAVAEEEYVALVAELYGREQLLSNAQERLAAAGLSDPVARVSEIAREYPDKYPRRQTTAANLQMLAEALQRAGSTQPVSPGPQPGPAEQLALDWLATALLGVVVLAAAAGILLIVQTVRERRRRRSPTRVRFSTGPPIQRRDRRPDHWKPVAEVTFDDGVSEVVSDARPIPVEAVSEPLPLGTEAASEPKPLVSETSDRWLPFGEAVSEARPLVTDSAPEPQPVGQSPAAPPDIGAPSASAIPTPTPARPGAAPEVHLPSPGSAARSPEVVMRSPKAELRPITAAPRPAPAGAVAVFHCHYHRGDDPYDSTHSVNDPASRVPVGACGVSSALSFGETGECCAFTVWLQDYLADDEIASLGLISRWAESAKARQVRSWASRERLQRVLVPSEGLDAVLETTNLRASIGVDRVGYWADSTVPPDASFAHLRVTFQISVKR